MGLVQAARQRAAEKEVDDEAVAERVAEKARKATVQQARKAERAAITRANEAKADAKRRQREEDARLANEQLEAKLRDKEARKAEKELERCAREREKQEAREATEGAARAALLPTTAVEPGITSSASRFYAVLFKVPCRLTLFEVEPRLCPCPGPRPMAPRSIIPTPTLAPVAGPAWRDPMAPTPYPDALALSCVRPLSHGYFIPSRVCPGTTRAGRHGESRA